VRFGLTAAAAVAVVALSQPAYALQVQTQVSSERVAAGESFYVQLTITSDTQGNRLSDARLPLPPGMSAGAPSAGATSSQVSIINGQMSQHFGVTVTWTVTASKPGSFRVGPPSVQFGGERATGQPIPIEVVPAGAGGTGGSAQGARRGFDPFDFLDPFGRGNSPFPPGMRSPFDDDNADQQEQQPTYPDELRIDRPPDPSAFVRATLSPDHVYVGQQVTLKVFAYGGRGNFSLSNMNEPSHADFLAFDASPDQFKAYLVPSGGQRYIAGKLRELPLFPLHAGTLRAGRMKMEFGGRGYTNDPNVGLMRESNWAQVVVIEPPLENRPPGYKIGDVGDYKLTATVEPRDIMAGEAVSVVATLSGVGSVPFSIQTPEHSGVEWLEPSLTEKVEPVSGVVQGTRTFSYVVKVNDAGKLDLGEVTLPYFDPKKRDYVIARAALGSLNVKPNPNAKAVNVDSKPNDHLADVLTKPRTTLGAFPALRQPLSDRPAFWALLLLLPFGMVVMGGGVSAVGRAREKLRVRGSSLGAQLDTALREARELANTDTPGSVNAVERAVFLAIELKLALKARAILKSELANALTERGLASARAQALARILEDVDGLRFVGAESGVDPTELAQRAAKNAAEMRAEKLTAAS
jgi:BatD DUF11 like domain